MTSLTAWFQVRSIPTLPLWMALAAALPKEWSPQRVYFTITILATVGLGIGATLLQAAEQAAQKRRCHTLRLEVRMDNAAAIALYNRSGYARCGRCDNYYEDGSAGWRYQKRLGEVPTGT